MIIIRIADGNSSHGKNTDDYENINDDYEGNNNDYYGNNNEIDNNDEANMEDDGDDNVINYDGYNDSAFDVNS